MKLALLIILILVCELILNLFTKYARYNIKSDKILVFLFSALYSVVWGLCLVNSESMDVYMYIYMVGIAQGVMSMITPFYIHIKYKNKKFVSSGFKGNMCKIIAFEWIEAFSEDEIHKLHNMSQHMMGKKGKNIMFIARSKEQSLKLMFLIYKQGNWTCVQEACNSYGSYELKKANKTKQFILCRLD